MYREVRMKDSYKSNSAVVISLIAAAVLVGGIYLVSLTMSDFRAILGIDTGFAHYYWKLPNITLWGSLTAWVLYLGHQISVWYLAFKLSKQPMMPKGTIGKYNVLMLAVNAIFILLHMLQSALFYDGLAQTVPVISSQGSVIVMLVMVLILMVARRGLFFGKKVPLPKKGTQAVFKVHGYFIAWALVYTFWFHPTEGTLGHLLGFFYMFMLMIQMSMAKTHFHNNIKWITVLEVYVAFHGAMVAVDAGNGMWPMFLFGFIMMFIVTQMYGLIKNRIAIAGIIAGYAAMALLVYSGIFGNNNTLAEIHQVTWIPLILYGLVFVIVWLLQGVVVLIDKRKAAKKASE